MHFPLTMKANLLIKKLHTSVKSLIGLVAIMSLCDRCSGWHSRLLARHSNETSSPTYTIETIQPPTFSRVSVP